MSRSGSVSVFPEHISGGRGAMGVGNVAQYSHGTRAVGIKLDPTYVKNHGGLDCLSIARDGAN